MNTESLLETICAGVRLCKWSPRKFTVFAASDATAGSIINALCDSGKCGSGREGNEYQRGLGLIQHVFAVRFGNLSVRVVSPGYPPRGMFSNLRSLEREIKP